MSNKTQKNDIGMDIFDFGPFDGNNDNNLNDQKIDILFYELSDLSSKLSDVRPKKRPRH